jgi:hypothetical protein
MTTQYGSEYLRSKLGCISHLCLQLGLFRDCSRCRSSPIFRLSPNKPPITLRAGKVQYKLNPSTFQLPQCTHTTRQLPLLCKLQCCQTKNYRQPTKYGRSNDMWLGGVPSPHLSFQSPLKAPPDKEHELQIQKYEPSSHLKGLPIRSCSNVSEVTELVTYRLKVIF